MNLDALFDDLEAQLEVNDTKQISPLTQIEKAKRICIEFGGRDRTTLVAPIFATDFVAGFEEQTANWMCVCHSTFVRIVFELDDDDELPALRRQEVDLCDFINATSRPAAAEFGFADGTTKRAVILEASSKLIFVRPVEGELASVYSLSALRFIRLLEATDRIEFQDWSNR